MTARAADCGACKHWREGEANEKLWTHDGIPNQELSFSAALSQPFREVKDGHWFACMAAHRPRFYKPRHEGDFDWGWRRCCEDFKPKEKP